MGLFFYVHSVALIEDLPIEEEYHTLEAFYADANAAYNQVSLEVIDFVSLSGVGIENFLETR